VPSATKNSALNVIKIGSAVERATWYSASSARTIGCIASNANIHFVSTARICSSVASATSHSETTAKMLSGVTSAKWCSASIARRTIGCIAINANIHFVSTASICSSVASATSHSATTAKILSTVTSVKRNSASIAKLPSIASNANRTSVLVAECRSLVMNAGLSFAPLGAKKGMNVVVRKTKRFLPKISTKQLTLEKLSRSVGHIILTDIHVAARTDTDCDHQVRSALHSCTRTNRTVFSNVQCQALDSTILLVF
jgi:hypothetical protein